MIEHSHYIYGAPVAVNFVLHVIQALHHSQCTVRWNAGCDSIIHSTPVSSTELATKSSVSRVKGQGIVAIRQSHVFPSEGLQRSLERGSKQSAVNQQLTVSDHSCFAL
jgi:hypothetical protein